MAATSTVLQAYSLEKRHTAEYIAMTTSNIMSEWEIDSSQKHWVVRVSGSNMVKTMSEGRLPNFGCFAHSLQLVVHDGVCLLLKATIPGLERNKK